MINLFLMVFIIIANVIAALTVYHSYGKKIEKNNRIKYTLIIIGALYIATLIIYDLSGLGVKSVNNASKMKAYMMMTFVPINVLILIPFSIYSFMQEKAKKISKQILNKRLVLVEIIAIVIIISEFITFRGFHKNMRDIADKIEQNAIVENESVENEIDENVINENYVIENNTIVNEVKNNSVNKN